MFSKNVPETKLNLLRNDFETDYRILTGDVIVERLYIDDLVEIIEYGWDRNDLQRLLNAQDYAGIGFLAAWIRECGNSDHGLIVDDEPYIYPLDEDGNYTEAALGRC